jgi:phage nucleotide-binding protein
MSIQIKQYRPQDAKIKSLVYGSSGVGKTTLGTTAPKPLFISAESGLLSVADKAVNYVEIKSLQDLRDVYALLQKGEHGYESIVIDSLTEIQSFIINKITQGKRMPQKSEWSDFGFEMNKILRLFRDLPYHVIFLALETEKDDEDDRSRYMPDLYGKVRTAGCAYMDFVGRMAVFNIQEGDAKVAKRAISFTATDRWIAKDRSGKLPNIVAPDFKAILEAIGTIETGEEQVVTDDNPQLASEDDVQRIKQLCKETQTDMAKYIASYNVGPTMTAPMAAKIIRDLEGRLSRMLDAA